MISVQRDINKSNPNEIKLELYALLGEGYKAMKEGREISTQSLKDRINQRRKEHQLSMGRIKADRTR